MHAWYGVDPAAGKTSDDLPRRSLMEPNVFGGERGQPWRRRGNTEWTEPEKGGHSRKNR